MIELTKVTKAFKNEEVLKETTIEFEKGKITGSVGRNGSGKTVLMKIICGLLKPTTGTVVVNGQRIGKDVDFPGDMVSSLIIVKLPFAVPDPIHEAQREQYRSLESYIQNVVVPDMQKKLRQGFGRAIRTEQDTCVVSILDHRAAKKGKYRGDVLDALPKCQMAEKIDEVEDFIRSRKVERYYS